MVDGRRFDLDVPRRGLRAVCVGVGTFNSQDDVGDEEPDLDRWGALPFAEQCTRDLQQALLAAGYDASTTTVPEELAAQQLGNLVYGTLAEASGDVAVVHVLSHGDYRPRGGVYVVGADGVSSPGTRVEEWLIRVSDDPSMPHTLFLLDLCHAGAATRLQWQPPPPGERERAWVIAATGASDAAYAGRLTRAAAAVIRRIVNKEIDFSPALPDVPFEILFDSIKHEVRRLAVAENGNEQDPTATPTVGSALVPFFVNPHYRPSQVRTAVEEVDDGIAPFADPVLDAEHFRDRAAGHGPATGSISAGCFTGRARELRQLTTWMDSPHAASDGLMILTGSPGVGKSALLGVLVCAAHPTLRNPTQSLWRHTAARPSQNSNLSAVHARQRSLGEILGSLVRQLHLEFADDVRVTAASVVDAIAVRPACPVIVIDAVDEALSERQLLNQLLVPLARKRRPDGTAACRLLVGMRPWREFAPLFSIAERTGSLIDLDDIPIDQRRRDLTEYVASLLELQPGYADIAQSQGRAAFAEAVATALVPTGDQLTDGSATDDRWGEFLVAALYTHAMTSQTNMLLTDPEDAAELGAQVPRTLPAVLELDLATRTGTPWMKPVLHAIAQGLGAGIPLTIIQIVAPAFAQGLSAEPTRQQVADALDAARFYLRTGTDTDGTTLYRLFHQGLTSQFVSRTMHPSQRSVKLIFDLLLNAVPKYAGRYRWDLAEPYLLRHAIQHAVRAERADELLADIEFLVHADPITLTAALGEAQSDTAALAAAVYATSAGRHQLVPPESRRQILALDAARHGAATSLDIFARQRGRPVVRWQPIWATGGQVNSALRTTVPSPPGLIEAMTSTQLAGRPIVVTIGNDQFLRLWDVETGRIIGEPLPGHLDTITAVACLETEGHSIAVTGSRDRTVRIWDLDTGEQLRALLPRNSGFLLTVAACTKIDERPIAVVISSSGWMRLLDLKTGQQVGELHTGHSGAVTALACIDVNGRSIAVTGGNDHTIRICDLSTQQQIGDPLLGHKGQIVGVACTFLNRNPIAVSASRDGTVRIWDLETRRLIGTVFSWHQGGVHALACTQLDGRAVFVTAGHDVRVWDLEKLQQLGDPLTAHTDSVNAVTCTLLDGHPVAVTASRDGTVRIWDLDSRRKIGREKPQLGHTDSVPVVACTSLKQRPIAVTASRDHTTRVWDLMSGQAIGTPLATGTLDSANAMACMQLHGSAIAVIANSDHRVRIWDLGTGLQYGDPLTGHTGSITALACTRLNGRPIAVTASLDRTIRLWGLDTRRPIGAPFGERSAQITGLACTTVDGRPVAVTVSQLGAIRLWNLYTKHVRPIGDSLLGHTGAIVAVACGLIGKVPIAVTAGLDQMMCVWNLNTMRQIGAPFVGHTGPIIALACGMLDTQPIAVTTSRDHTIQVCNLKTRQQTKFSLPSPANAVAAAGDVIVAAGIGWDIAALQRAPERIQWSPEL